MSGHAAEPEVPHDETDPFVKKVALSVAIYAVVLVLAGAGGSNAGKDMLMGQMQASNEWSRYQAKVQREVMYQQEREMLEQAIGPIEASVLARWAGHYEATQKDRAKLSADPAERQKFRLAYITAKLAEYDQEKKELSKNATDREKDRDTAHRKDPYFDFAEMLLQIGVVLASISMLSKARWPYAVSLLLAFVGLLLTLNGYFLVAQVPFIDTAAHAEVGH